MGPVIDDHDVTVWHGDARTVLGQLPAGSVQCIVTSPPYYSLRDYGVAGQIGLEASPAEYVEQLRAVFAEARRVLAPDGVMWINLGDSYSGGARATYDTNGGKTRARGHAETRPLTGIPGKNLLGMPWRTAFALQDDGWILRNDIIWAKPNAMPESVTDRLSTRHEHVFLLTRSRRYWFGLDAIRERLDTATIRAHMGQRSSSASGINAFAPSRIGGTQDGMKNGQARIDRALELGGKNPGDVWSIPTSPTPYAHFATMPPELARRCIQAGCPEEVCRACGKARTPIYGKGALNRDRPQARRAMELAEQHGLTDEHIAAVRSVGMNDAGKAKVVQSGAGRNSAEVQQLADEAKTALGGYFREFLMGEQTVTGWTDCGCGAGFRPGVVLDPFAGSGTTLMVARQLGRKAVGVELNPTYVDIIRRRIGQEPLNFDQAAVL